MPRFTLKVNGDTYKVSVDGDTPYGKITISSGRVAQRNFDDYPLLGIHEMPNVEIYVVDRNDTPGAAGEPAVPPIAPAVTNAIFALTGQRIRSLPISLNEMRIM
ncbi:MAG: hypothetical protein CMG71_04895 [Candidatus Marinimicrobia bacterium]|nr:hypothetical protein [Candidatus Neomarinimicrobiota bacterium]|tara:strand:+ start:2623 stop:2934 length:312 start_codon:yes stop_codon:yes gene_type:complete